METQPSRISLAPLILVCAVAVAVTATIAHAQIPCEYEVTAIIHPPDCPPFGIPPTIGMAISEPIDGGLPNVVGYYQSCAIGPDTAFLWIGNEDKFITIPMPAGTSYSKAVAISGSRIVGEYDNADIELGRTGFLYDYETDEFTSLGTLPGGNWSEAHAINSAGEIVGMWGDVVNGPFPQAFIWRDGVMIDITPDFGPPRGEANGINTAGLVTGWMGTSPLTDARAFIWENGDVTELPLVPNGVTAKGEAINEHGHVAGEGRVFLDDGRAMAVQSFLWADNQITDLGTLPDTTFTRARDIDCQNRIAGYCHNAGLVDLAPFIWQDHVMTNINDLLPSDSELTVYRAEGINNAGQITGSAANQNNDPVAFILTPIESPTGDLDGDCEVGAVDLLMLLASWGPCDNCEDCPADLNGDCMVGAVDLLILLANWG